jgi:hypothetical protein
MNFCKSIVFACALVLAATPLLATTYYVSPAGNDAYPGTSQTTPWKTIAHVNSARFNSGDSVLFLAGGTWREELISTSTGITFGSYGTGARPIISGANLYTSGWTSVRTDVWSVLVGGYEPEQVWFNGVLGQSVASAAAVVAPNQWFFSNTGYLTVYSASTPNTSSTTAGIEAAQRDSAFAITAGGNVTVTGLAFVNPNYTTINIAANVFGTQTFNNDVWRGAQYEGLLANGGTEVVTNSEGIYNEMGISVGGGDGISVTNSILSGNTDGAIEIYGTTAPSTIKSSTLTGNATPNPLSPVVQNYDDAPLTISHSIYLPNPEYSIESTYIGLTDDGTNVNTSPAFQQRAAPLIIVPFIDDYNNLAVAQSVSTLAHQNGCTLSYALNTKLVTPADWKTIASMEQAGDEIVAHTRSHSDLANNNVVTIQYKGTATTAKMSIVNGVSLKTFLNGSATPDLNVDLSNTWNGMIDICNIVNAKASYSCVPLTNQNYFTPALLASASNVNIKTPYVAVASSTYLNWEVQGAISDIQANIPGYTVKSFATPFTSSSPAVEAQVQSAGVAANRNGLLNPDNLPNGNWLLSGPFDVYNLASMWIPSAFDATQPTSSAAAVVEGMGANGAVMAMFSHGTDEFSLASWQTLFQNLHSFGVTCMTMNQAIQYIKTNGTLVPDGTNKNWVRSVPLTPNFSNTAASPAQGAHGLQ